MRLTRSAAIHYEIITTEIITETSAKPSTVMIDDNDKEVLQNRDGEVNMDNMEKRFEVKILLYMYAIALLYKFI